MKQLYSLILLFLPTALISQLFQEPYDIIHSASFSGLFAMDIELDDINCDGYDDFLSVNPVSRSLLVFYGDPSYNYDHAVHLTSEEFQSVNEARIIDYDFDGDPDILAIQNGNLVWYENKNCGSNWARHFLTEEVKKFETSRVVDYDQDGDYDLFSYHYPFDLKLCKGNPNGRMDESITVVNHLESSVQFMEMFDLDSDDQNELIIRNYNSSGSISYFEIDSNGNLSDQHILSESIGTVAAIEFSDLDSDGDIDFIIHNMDASVDWFENLGPDLGYSEEQHIGESSYQNFSLGAIHTIDIDNDGDQDILVGNSGNVTSEIILFTNDGSNQFDRSPFCSISSYCSLDINQHDLNHDGIDELIIYGSSDKEVKIVFMNSSGEVEHFENLNYRPSSLNDLIIIDIDGDGDKDLITSSRLDNGLIKFENKGAGVYGRATKIISSDNPKELIYEDFDKDGDKDFMINEEFHGATFFENLEGFISEGVSLVNVSGNSNNPIFEYADMNNDGYLDLVHGGVSENNRIHVLWNSDMGFDPNSSEGISDIEFNHIELIDCDHDGWIDILASTEDENMWLRNLGNGSFDETGTFFENEYLILEAFDINNDDFKDLILFNYSTAELMFVSNPSESEPSEFRHIATLDHKPENAILKDLNGDGLVDIAAHTSFGAGLDSFFQPLYEHELLYILQTKDGTFTNPTLLVKDEVSLSSILLEDVDGDLDPDIVFISRGELDRSQIKILYNQSNASPQLLFSFGKNDLTLFPNPTDANSAIYLGHDFSLSHYELYNAQGLFLEREYFQETEIYHEVQSKHLNSGQYLVRVFGKDGTHQTTRLIKE